MQHVAELFCYFEGKEYQDVLVIKMFCACYEFGKF